mmetsp:Transcript_1960/g.2937  ORF Transcript_1960/g.2937 Transcript_1960/m.2937 type:complete len:226 (-) Transcript_1960:351-1028(-)
MMRPPLWLLSRLSRTLKNRDPRMYVLSSFLLYSPIRVYTSSSQACSTATSGASTGEECKGDGVIKWRRPQDVFHEWSLDGRDARMAAGHAKAVAEILGEALPRMGSAPGNVDREDGFTAIDAGCGNGWVARKIKEEASGCRDVIGVDGAPGMIERAKEIDPEGKYEVVDLKTWNPKEQVDLVHSMEVLYYLGDDLEKVLNRIHSTWLKPGGVLAAGVDFYSEHKE